ncbi:hypothetical protein diail_10744, partial [Diaporthe ilicicola]
LLTKYSSVLWPRFPGEKIDELRGGRKSEAIERQETLKEAYDSGYSAGFEAGARAEAAKSQKNPTQTDGTYAQGFAAGQRRLMHSEIAFAFARGQQAERRRIRACLDEGEHLDGGEHIGQVYKTPGGSLEAAKEPSKAALRNGYVDASSPDPPAPHSRQNSSKGSELSRASSSKRPSEVTVASDALISPPLYSRHTVPHTQPPAATSEGTVEIRRRVGRPRLHLQDVDSRHAVATCVFCGLELSQNSMLRHKRRHHAAELAAVGVPLQQFPCWWPGCGQLPDNLVMNQLTTHLQRKHNFTPPGEPNAFTENIKYIRRMPMNLLISIITEAAQQLNAVKLRIQDLEAQLRRRDPSYVSQHALPNVHILHESRRPVLTVILKNRERLPLIVQELRQLTRARGLRSQMRKDEGTWWEVADDLEAGLEPSSRLAQAVIALSPPGDGPTVQLSPNILSDGPNMNDPSWRPRYTVPFQDGWELKVSDENLVWVPPGAGTHRTKPSAAIPASIHPVTAFQDDEEDEEEDDGYRKLMAEISRRVLDDKQQSDWVHTSSDEYREEPDDAEENLVRHASGKTTTREVLQEVKRPMAAAASPRTKKRCKAG